MINAYLGREISYNIDVDKKQHVVLKDKFTLNLESFEHIGIFAKSSGGKSYGALVLLEESILVPHNIFSTIFIDPLGNSSTMRIPNRTGEIDVWNNLLNRNEISPKGMGEKVKFIIPADSIKKFDKLMYDATFSIATKNLTVELFCYAFGLKPLDAQASLYGKVKKQMDGEYEGNDYSLEEFLEQIRSVDYHPSTKDALIRKLEALENLNFITKSAPEVYDIVKPNQALIFNLSMSSRYTNRLIVNFFAQQLMEHRNLINSKINLAKIKIELEEKEWRQYNDWYLPPVRLIIDEAHEFLPRNPVLQTFIKLGRNIGCLMGFISQRADLEKDNYANMGHLFIGPMRFDEDISTLRALTGTERSHDNFKKLVKQQTNGCFLYHNLNSLYSEKLIRIRPRYSLHPASNQAENELKYLDVPKYSEYSEYEEEEEEQNGRENFLVNQLDPKLELVEFLGKSIKSLDEIPIHLKHIIPILVENGILRKNNDKIAWTLKPVG